jgi:hypothetical protein
MFQNTSDPSVPRMSSRVETTAQDLAAKALSLRTPGKRRGVPFKPTPSMLHRCRREKERE